MRTDRILGTLALLATVAVVRPAAAQIFVDAAGTCGGLTPCFTTIQAGVNNATDSGMDEDGLVVVFPGTYAESVNLDLMGSAVMGGTRGDITIINYELFSLLAPVATAPGSTATAPLVLDATTPQALAAQLEALREDLPARIERALGGRPVPSAADPNAAMGLTPVNIFPAAGPAIYHTGTFPGLMTTGDVSLRGLTVKSANDSGISLPDVDGDVSVVATHADDNFLAGMLIGASGEIDIVAVTASRNKGGVGLSLEGGGSTMLMINVVADDNALDGVNLLNLSGSALFISTDLASLQPLTEFDRASASGNLNGIKAFVGSMGVANALLGPTGSAIDLNDNDAAGLDAACNSGFTLVGVRANRNHQGIKAAGHAFMLVAGVSANDNTMGSGLDVSTDYAGMPIPTLGPLAGIITSSTASGNSADGFKVTTSGSGVVLTGNAAVKNGAHGALVSVASGSTPVATGNILCQNPTAGLQLQSNVAMNAEGGWWGATTGPTNSANPGGTGDKVADAGNGGNGTVDFTPFVDLTTVDATPGVVVNQNTYLSVQFSDAARTVFLGPEIGVLVGPFFTLPPDPPFTASTDNGVVSDGFVSGASIPVGINQPQGTIRVGVVPDHVGTATVQIQGPCGLSGTATYRVVPHQGAPLLSVGGLALLAAGLAWVGLRRVARG